MEESKFIQVEKHKQPAAFYSKVYNAINNAENNISKGILKMIKLELATPGQEYLQADKCSKNGIKR